MNEPVVVVLGQASVPIARKLMTALPGSTLYGLTGRTADVDVSINNFGETVRSLFTSNTPIIGICAAGILIRTLAPLLTDKRHEPPVLAVAEDGSAVVPLLGGLHGVNDLARQIAAALEVAPAITTTGDLRFRTTLLNPPAGYQLANPDDAKSFIADLLAGATTRLDGAADWLSNSNLPIAPDGNLTLRVTERAVATTPDCLVYHPATVLLGIARQLDPEQSELGQLTPGQLIPGQLKLEPLEPDIATAIAQIHQTLTEANLAIASIAGVFALDNDMGDPLLEAIAHALNVPLRYFSPADITVRLASAKVPAGTDIRATQAVLTAVGATGQLVSSQAASGLNWAIAIAAQPVDPQTIGRSRGQLTVVGTGPGGAAWMSPDVKEVLRSATDWVGYKVYLDLAGTLREGQQRHESDNREELDRARFALELATTGKSVAVVSSGDPGIFAMAAAVFEVLESDAKPEWACLDIRVAPGISAMQAAAALVGAPLGHDFCAISLSDILKPWTVIEQRIAAAAQADFVMAFYNPVSKQRTWQLGKAKEVLLQWRSPQTPVVLARNVSRPGQTVRVCTLAEFNPADADMRTLIIVGSSQTRTIPRPHGGVWVYTPRRYDES